MQDGWDAVSVQEVSGRVRASSILTYINTVRTATAPLKVNPVAPTNDIRLTFLESNSWLWQVRCVG